jgi:hypothetical protein
MQLFNKQRGVDYMYTLGEKYGPVVKLNGVLQVQPHPDAKRLEHS